MPLFLPSAAAPHPISEDTYTCSELHPPLVSWGRGHQPPCPGGRLHPCTSSSQDTQHAAQRAQPKPTPGMEMVFPPQRLLPKASRD